MPEFQCAECHVTIPVLSRGQQNAYTRGFPVYCAGEPGKRSPCAAAAHARRSAAAWRTRQALRVASPQYQRDQRERRSQRSH